MRREFENESEIELGFEFEIGIVIQIRFDSDGDIEIEIKSYFKIGCFKTVRSFKMIISLLRRAGGAVSGRPPLSPPEFSAVRLVRARRRACVR